MNDPIERQDAIDALIKWYGCEPADIGAFENIIEKLPSAQPEIIYCKDCIHRPIVDDPDAKDGFGLQFPDFRCPCRCDDGYYSWMPKDNWFCGNGEKEEKTNE